MAFLKNLGDKIGSAAGSAADKAKKMAEISKLNSAIGTEEKNMTQVYLEIGKQIFEEHRSNPASPVVELCNKIIIAQQNILDLKQKIADLKTEEKPEVVEKVEEAPVVEEAEIAMSSAPARRFCTECGTEITSTSKFCNSCGTPTPITSN